jgi:hypothetical protein
MSNNPKKTTDADASFFDRHGAGRTLHPDDAIETLQVEGNDGRTVNRHRPQGYYSKPGPSSKTHPDFALKAHERELDSWSGFNATGGQHQNFGNTWDPYADTQPREVSQSQRPTRRSRPETSSGSLPGMRQQQNPVLRVRTPSVNRDNPQESDQNSDGPLQALRSEQHSAFNFGTTPVIMQRAIPDEADSRPVSSHGSYSPDPRPQSRSPSVRTRSPSDGSQSPYYENEYAEFEDNYQPPRTIGTIRVPEWGPYETHLQRSGQYSQMGDILLTHKNDEGPPPLSWGRSEPRTIDCYDRMTLNYFVQAGLDRAAWLGSNA